MISMALSPFYPSYITQTPHNNINITSNRMNGNKDNQGFTLQENLETFSKLHELLGPCSLKEFSNIKSSVNPLKVFEL